MTTIRIPSRKSQTAQTTIANMERLLGRPGVRTRPNSGVLLRRARLFHATTAVPVAGKGLAIFLLYALLAACTSVHTRTLEQGEVQMSQTQFAAQFERVFRYHNRIMNQLIMELPGLALSDDDSEDITDVEEQMNEACDPLNEVASLEAVSQHADFWTQRDLPEAVPECEKATRDVEDLFRKLGTRHERRKARQRKLLQDSP